MKDTERMLAGRVVAMPADTNGAGDIFGGWLLARADLAGSTVAVQRARGRVATVAVRDFRFLRPVRVGDLVTCWAVLDRIGTTSLTVRVEVEAERMGPGACRTLDAGCVGRSDGWMQGVSCGPWLFHGQTTQRGRRRPNVQPEGPGPLFAHSGVAARLFGMIKRRFAAPCSVQKSAPAHPRPRSDMLLNHETEHVAEGVFVYVALDETGRPRPVEAP